MAKIIITMRFFCFFALMLCFNPLFSQGTDVEINLTEAGSLEREIDMLEITRIDNLIIHGKLGYSDLSTLRSASGKLSMVNCLDLSDITLVADEEHAYAELYTGFNGLSNQYYYDYYYISDNCRQEVDKGQTGLGVGTVVTLHYCNDLSAVFSTQAYKKIILPKLESIGERLVNGNKVVETVIIPDGPKFVGCFAFASAPSLTNLVIPASVDSIGKRAFREFKGEMELKATPSHIGYEAFEEAIVPEIDFSKVKSIGEYAFYQSSVSGNIDLSGLASVPTAAFSGTGITGVHLSQDCSEIGSYAFSKSKLETIDVPFSCNVRAGAFGDTPWYSKNAKAEGGIIYIGATAYETDKTFEGGDVTIKEGTRYLNDNLFKSKKAIETINLPESIESIGEEAFAGQNKIESIKWPASLTEIGASAFSECSSLNTCDLPDNLKKIGGYAFRNCTSILEVTLPESLETVVGGTPFQGCTNATILHFNSVNLGGYSLGLGNLNHIIVGPKVEYIPSFYSQKLRRVRFEKRDEATLLRLGDNAFSGCVNLEECLLPDNTVSIGSGAFSGDKNVNIGTFPSKVRHVGAYAFEKVEHECEILSCAIDSIADNAFYGWKGLKKIEFAKTPGRMGNGCLAGTSIKSFHIPASLMNADEITYPFMAGAMYSTVCCEELTDITFEEGAEKVSVGLKGVKADTITLPDGIKELNSRFDTSLKHLSLPAECLSFDKYNFIWNYNVSVSWRIPEGYVYEGDASQNYIPSEWYTDKRDIDSLILPEGICGIEQRAFYGSGIWNISFPSTLEWMYEDCFKFSNDPSSVLIFNSIVPPQIINGNNGCLGYKPFIVIVPFGTKEAYKNIFYKNTTIEEMPGTVTFSIINSSDKEVFMPDDELYLSVVADLSYIEVPTPLWTSSDTSVATVEQGEQAKVTLLKDGECDIQASITFRDETYTAAYHLVVDGNSGIEEVEISQQSLVKVYDLAGILVFEGDKEELSLSPGVYIVHENGKVTKAVVQ